MKKVAIQGIRGSFHDLVTDQFFDEKVQIVPCVFFEEVAEKLSQGEVDYGVMAVENTLAGALLPNHMLIDQYDLFIIEELYIPVRHHLMALPGQKIEDIKEVRSHPMALLQCRDFLKQYPEIKRIEYEDTAVAARDIAEQKLQRVAAIAPEKAAHIYGLQILASDIQDHHTNTTRFVVLTTDIYNFKKGSDKISMKIFLPHQPGSLAKVLKIFSKYKWNLTKIQSVPIFGRPWEYAFFIDAVYPEGFKPQKMMSELLKVIKRFKILGIYKNRLP